MEDGKWKMEEAEGKCIGFLTITYSHHFYYVRM